MNAAKDKEGGQKMSNFKEAIKESLAIVLLFAVAYGFGGVCVTRPDRNIRHSVPLERFKMNKIHYRKHKAWAASSIKMEDREWHEMQARLCLDSCRTWRAHQSWKMRIGA